MRASVRVFAIVLFALAGVASAVGSLRARAEAASTWVQYRHPTIGITIRHPSGWETLSGDGKAALVAIGPAAKGVPAVRLSVIVVVIPVPARATVRDARDDLERELARRMGSIQLLRTDEVDLNGVSAILTYVTRHSPQGTALYQMVLIAAHDRRGYAIAGTTAATSTQLAEETLLLQRLVLSFRPR
jgi:hypothetical protein